MPGKKLKYMFGKFLISLADFIESSKTQKTLDQETFQKELNAFMQNYQGDAKDKEKFQFELNQYLKDKGYFFDRVEVNFSDKGKKSAETRLPKRITKISEDLNFYAKGLDIFTDTTEMIPGLICYTIEKIGPTDKVPYVRYRPVPRVITQVHDSGVNGGTIFFSYNHTFLKSMDFYSEKTGKVFSDETVIYSPLTEQQANYICKLLNTQSRLYYQKMSKQKQKTK